MKRISTVLVGLSLLASSSLYASGNNMNNMDHGKMNMSKKNDNMNKMDMSNKSDNMGKMDHGNMDMSKKSMSNMTPYHNKMMSGDYMATLSSDKPLMDGKNHMTVMLMKNGEAVKNADVSIKFSMPSMPGMEFTEHAKMMGNMYKTKVMFSMGGEWAYELMFKTSDGQMHKTTGSVNLK